MDWLLPGTHGHNKWRLLSACEGLLLESETRTGSSWLQATEVSKHFNSFRYLFPVLVLRQSTNFSFLSFGPFSPRAARTAGT
jgi:hypothetical protein